MARVRDRTLALVACLVAGGFGGWARGAAAAEPPEARSPACVPTCGRIEGRLRAAGERQPVESATIIAIAAGPELRPGILRHPPALPEDPGWQEVATTDAEGHFVLPSVPSQNVRLIVLAPGFDRLEYVVTVASQGPTQVKLFAAPTEDASYRTVVRTPSQRRAAPTSRLLSPEEIRTMPGTQGDPLRALQNLPGVARAPGSLGLLVLRGAAPGQSRVFLGGHAVPRAFHVLSLASVFPTEVIDQLEFVPGNFDAAYGNATGGVVVVEPRAGRRDGFHGYGEIDLTAAGAMVEGPVGKGSFVMAAQRGYIDAIVGIADRVIERTTGDAQSILRPSYYDYQGLFDYPVGHQATIGVRLFGSGDRVRGDPGSTPQLAELDGPVFEFRSDFHRLDLVFRKRRGPGEFRLIPSSRFEINRYNASGGIRRRVRRDLVIANRAEYEHQVTPRFRMLVGSDFEVARFWGRDDSQMNIFTDPEARNVERVTGVESNIGFYTTADFRLGRFTLRPGVRASAFTVASKAAFSVDPRGTALVDLSDAWRLHFGLGRYSQARSLRESESLDLIGQGSGVGEGSLYLPPVFSRFNPNVELAPVENTDLTVLQAIHASAGARYDLGEGFTAEATGFLREQDNGTPARFEGAVVPYASHERAVGFEFLLRKRLTEKLYGWVAYTLMWANVRFAETEGVLERDERPSDFDQRHNFILLGSYELPRRWRIGGRFRVVSGYPFTPVIGAVNFQPSLYGAISGQRNAERLPVFHQLDLRVDKRWIRRRAIFTAYLEIQNVYNRQNPEAVIYGPDFRQKIGVIGLPIFPALGFRIDY